MTSTELVLRVLALPSRLGSELEPLGEARLLPAAGLSGMLALPIVRDGCVTGTVSFTVHLWLDDEVGPGLGAMEPWEPSSHWEEYAEEEECFPTRAMPQSPITFPPRRPDEGARVKVA
uniref:Uncharacterized protein n=2 Tax=Alexandrium monilatum TaxID=311494 RepID=A0A7S4WFU3_9DINO